jgi:hypothetical protein
VESRTPVRQRERAVANRGLGRCWCDLRDGPISIQVTDEISWEKKLLDIEKDICYDRELPMSKASVNNQGGET